MDGAVGAKRAMRRLRRLKYRWRIKQTVPFFAYARSVDVHRASGPAFSAPLSRFSEDFPSFSHVFLRFSKVFPAIRGEDRYEDELSEGDSDLDEPVHY